MKVGQAKKQLSALLVEVEAGEELVIFPGSTPVARVMASSDGRYKPRCVSAL